jgi:hypothetical protein
MFSKGFKRGKLKNMVQSRLLEGLDRKKIKEAINDYEYTCQTIIVLTNIIAFNMKGKVYQGKPLLTSSGNTVSPTTTVTPDLAIEIPAQNGQTDYLAVNEIKVNLPKEKKYWFKDAQQLKKYDDDLQGWTLAGTSTHDVMFTTIELRTFGFHQYMDELSSTRKLQINRNFAILHSTPLEQDNSFIIIKKDHGVISNATLDSLLSNGVGVPRLKIIQEINQMKFFDSEPPIIYTMMIIWDHVLKTFLSTEQMRTLKGNKIFSIKLTVEEVYKKISRYAPQSNPSCIQHSWIRKALLGFAELNLARSSDTAKESFEVRFRAHKGKILDWLLDEISNRKEDERTASLDEFIVPKEEKPQK